MPLTRSVPSSVNVVWFSCFMVTGLKIEAVMSGWGWAVCGSFHLGLPPVQAALRDSCRCLCVCLQVSICSTVGV